MHPQRANNVRPKAQGDLMSRRTEKPLRLWYLLYNVKSADAETSYFTRQLRLHTPRQIYTLTHKHREETPAVWVFK